MIRRVLPPVVRWLLRCLVAVVRCCCTDRTDVVHGLTFHRFVPRCFVTVTAVKCTLGACPSLFIHPVAHYTKHRSTELHNEINSVQ